MAGSGRKIFTAGDVLTASDVQNYLMDQSVMNFAGTAARSSAVATPTTGMVSYIGTTGTATIPQLETYTGSAWQTPYGMTLVATATFSAASSISLDNVFTSRYDNYRIIMDLTTGAGSANLYLRVRAGGVDNSATAYGYTYPYFFMVPGTNSDIRGTGASAVFLPQLNSGTVNSYFLDVQNPAKSTATTQFMGQCVRYNSEAGYLIYGYNNTTASYDGLTLYPASGNFTGSIKIYGYRNA